MGNSDPIDFINMETQRLPFKQSVMNFADWSKTFRTWPNATADLRDWFRRVSDKKSADWETNDLSQCLTLSLSTMKRNEPLLISASYFGSNAINAFIFGHGPMTLTLADIFMLTGLRIIGHVSPYEFLSKGSKKF